MEDIDAPSYVVRNGANNNTMGELQDSKIVNSHNFKFKAQNSETNLLDYDIVKSTDFLG